MSQPVYLGCDLRGRRYYATSDYASVGSPPWGTAQFDSLVLVVASAMVANVENALRTLVAANTDWIYTAGFQAKLWHDRVDQLSVEMGRQSHVGDGSPMTAWFDDIQSLDQWEMGSTFGNSSYFLFVVVGGDIPASFRISFLGVVEQPDPIERALAELRSHRTFRHGRRTMTIACLIRAADWTPLDAPWWHDKQVCIIGVDLDGNLFLRHCDGTIWYWDHRLRAGTLVAMDVRDFVSRIT